MPNARNILARKIFIAVFGVLGLLFGAGAAYLVVDARKFAATAEHAEGVVTNLALNYRGRSFVAYPVIRFQGPNGAVEFQSNLGSNPPIYKVGDKVPLLYRPEDPHDARVDSFGTFYLEATVMGFLAVVFGGVAGLILLTGGRATRR
jgi:hypothetical protein